MTIFSELKSQFQILDYLPTHNQILIRSMKNNDREYNIDIIIKGVYSIFIPSSFKGIEISVVDKNEAKKLIDHYGFKISKDYKIFLLKDSEGKLHYINAMGLGVYHNKLEIIDTSLGRYDWEGLGEDILWYAD